MCSGSGRRRPIGCPARHPSQPSAQASSQPYCGLPRQPSCPISRQPSFRKRSAGGCFSQPAPPAELGAMPALPVRVSSRLRRRVVFGLKSRRPRPCLLPAVLAPAHVERRVESVGRVAQKRNQLGARRQTPRHQLDGVGRQHQVVRRAVEADVRGAGRDAGITPAVPAEVDQVEPAREVADLLVPDAHAGRDAPGPRPPVVRAVRLDQVRVQQQLLAQRGGAALAGPDEHQRGRRAESGRSGAHARAAVPRLAGAPVGLLAGR
eukprot:scaffold31649_cov101-Isochrysis_galbana.AAC.4